MRKKTFFIPVVIVSMAMAMFTRSAGAGSVNVAPLQLASTPSPFPAGCSLDGPGTNYINAEVEPWIAVNPANPDNVVAVYQQDRWSSGGARGLVTAVTHNFTQPGGATWNHTFPHFSFCAGGTAANGGDFARATDPWVTFAPNGDAYQLSMSTDATALETAMLVSKSTDGGDTWSEPATLIRDASPYNFNDKGSITADPANPNFVYAVWDRSRKPGENADFNALHAFAFRGDAMFARTTDGGATWETPRNMLPTNANQQTIGHQIAVLPDGTLVDVFAGQIGSNMQPASSTIHVSVLRSTDKGATWSRVIDISTIEIAFASDPDTGAAVRTGFGIPGITVDPINGTIYVVWEDGRFSGGAHPDVALSRSIDGGLTWSAPVKVNRTTNNAAAFVPAVHSAADGTVAVTYYDFRNNTPAAGALTDYWILHCHAAATDCSNAANWGNEARLSPASFDIETAPYAHGYFLGDYQGLASFGNTFVPIFIQANSGNIANRTDAFVTTVAP